jgi:AraC-like DNA-binding protein/ligand-binding sensor protein
VSRLAESARLASLLAADPVFEEARRLAAETTGFRIGVVYLPRRSSPRPAAAPKPRSKIRFCDLVRSSPQLLKRCDQSDQRGAELCARRGRPVTYSCHAGLTEVIAPVKFEGRLVAAVNCGQVLLRRPTTRGFAKLWKGVRRSGLDRGNLERAYMAIPVCSEERVRTAARILALAGEHLASCLRLEAGDGPAPGPGDRAERYLAYCARLVKMMEAGAPDEEVLTGMDRLAARLAGAGQANPEAVSAAVEYLVENYAGRPTLGEAARRTGLSAYYLGRIFRRAVGVSPAGFLRELRARRACDLLGSGGGSIAEVAARVGYLDPAYFCRHFTRTLGMSPTAWRSGARGVALRG